MENANRLYDAVFSMLSQHRHWRDVRHPKTLCWMVVGLRLEQPDQLNGLAGLHSESSNTTAQSIQRRFSRWLNNTRIQERLLYAPLIRQALSEWKATRTRPRAGHQSAVEALLFDSSLADLSRTSDSGNVEGDTAQK